VNLSSGRSDVLASEPRKLGPVRLDGSELFWAAGGLAPLFPLAAVTGDVTGTIYAADLPTE
jgi:hypothetical protein